MLPPHELKNKTFSRVLRGYNSVEVDEHLSFVMEKYTELYRQNDELERKLKLAEAQLAEFRADEESIRSALVNAQKASSKIIGEANDRADVIMRSAKTNCDKVIANFRGDMQKQRDELLVLRRTVAEFKAKLFAQYQQHLTYIEEISPDGESGDADTPDEVFVRRVVNQVKNDIASGKVAVNTVRDDEPIIAYVPPARPEQNPQPAIREITRSQAGTESAVNTPELEFKQAPNKPQPQAQTSLFDEVIADKPQSKVSAANTAAETAVKEPTPVENEDDADGGGYLDDEIDIEDITKTAKTAQTETNNYKYADAAAEPDTVMFGSVKPSMRPSTIAATTAKTAATGTSSTAAAVEKKAFENSDTDEIIQTGKQKAPQNTYRSTSVKDTIRELNRKFSADETEAAPDAAQSDKKLPRQESYAPDPEDEELLSMIRSVTSASDDKDKTAQNKNKKKNKTKPLSLTEEFDLISEDDAPKNGK